MGQTLSEHIDEKEKNGEKDNALMLRKIERDMDQRFKEKKATLYIEALNDECLPIICAVDTFYDFFYIQDKSKDFSNDIGIILNKHLSGEYKDTFAGLVKSVVEYVLKERSAETYTHVVYANGTFLRIDFYIYFTHDTLFYFVQVGVLDMKRVRRPVLIYELARATDRNKLDGLKKEAEESAQSSKALLEKLDEIFK